MKTNDPQVVSSGVSIDKVVGNGIFITIYCRDMYIYHIWYEYVYGR